MTELMAMVYGQNYGIGDFLEEAVNRVANTSTRSTQSLSVSKLVNDFGFKIIIIGYNFRPYFWPRRWVQL